MTSVKQCISPLVLNLTKIMKKHNIRPMNRPKITFAQMAVGTACAALTAVIAVKGGEFLITKTYAQSAAPEADYKCGSLHGSASVMNLPGREVEFIVRTPAGRIQFMSTGVYTYKNATASARDFCTNATPFPRFFEKASQGAYECIGASGEAAVRRDAQGGLVIHYNGEQINTALPYEDAVKNAARMCVSGKRHVIT